MIAKSRKNEFCTTLYFPLEKDLSVGVFISYNAAEHSGRPLIIGFSYLDGKDYYDQSSERRKYRSHVKYNFLPENKAKVSTYHDECLPVQPPLHSIEKDGDTYKFKITSPTTGREITVSFSDLIDINEWG